MHAAVIDIAFGAKPCIVKFKVHDIQKMCYIRWNQTYIAIVCNNECMKVAIVVLCLKWVKIQSSVLTVLLISRFRVPERSLFCCWYAC